MSRRIVRREAEDLPELVNRLGDAVMLCAREPQVATGVHEVRAEADRLGQLGDCLGRPVQTGERIPEPRVGLCISGFQAQRRHEPRHSMRVAQIDGRAGVAGYRSRTRVQKVMLSLQSAILA